MRATAKYVTSTPDPLPLLERIGRLCYRSDMKDSEVFIRKLITRGHESVLEHASATFLVTCDRAISHEIVRHRIASYTQESTRYIKYDRLEVIDPDMPTVEAEQICENIIRNSEEAYRALIKLGVAPQIARAVFPHCLMTRLYWTANFREWRHIIKLRTASGAHPQIRELTFQILEWFRTNYPVIVEDIL